MSQLILKIIALVAMIIDHIGFVFGTEGWNLLALDSAVLRAIGRVSFPLFAFCLAQGWRQTHYRKRYFRNLAAGAVVSQVPFSMAFYAPNLSASHSERTLFQFSWAYLFFGIVALLVYWHFILHRHYNHSLLLVGLVALVPGIRLKFHGFWILCENLNVFYTFVMALFCLYIFAHRYEFEKGARLGLLIALPILLSAYAIPADYGTGLLGIVLIIGFCVLESKALQVIFLLLWSWYYYGFLVGNPVSTLSCAFAGIFILFYKPAVRGRFRAKKLFYIFYPLHLLILGLFNAGKL